MLAYKLVCLFLLDQVDLFIKSFRLEESDNTPTDILKTDMFVDFQLKIGLYKTPTGVIAAVSPGDPDGFSMIFNFYLSSKPVLSADAVLVPITYSPDQRFILKRGITTNQPSDYEITINGANLKIDLTENPEWTFYCGNLFLVVEIKDLKNVPPIDPNPANNVAVYPVAMECEGDQISVTEFSVAPRLPQAVVYSGVDVEMDLSLMFWNNGDHIFQHPDGRQNFFLSAYMSDDTSLDLDLDAAIQIFSVSPEIESQLNSDLLTDDSMYLNGRITLHFPLSACTLTYLIFEIHTGVHTIEKEKSYINNLRYMDVTSIIKCSIDYVDFSVSSFSLDSGSVVVQPGSTYNFSMTASVAASGTSMADQVTYQFYLSNDEKFDSEDLSFDFVDIAPANVLDVSAVVEETVNIPVGDSGRVEATVPECGAHSSVASPIYWL